MNRFLRILKGILVDLFYLVAGFVLMFFPEIAKALSLPFVNTEEVINQQWNFWFGLVLSIFSLLAIIYRVFQSKKMCIIKIDGMNGKKIKTENVKSAATQEFAFYNVNIVGKATQQNIYQAYTEMKTTFKLNEEKGLYDEYLFYGFNYTPFLFMLGQLYSDNRNYRFYHLQQANGSEKRIRLPRFIEPKDGNELNEPSLNTNANSKTLVIRVSPSRPSRPRSPRRTA